MWKNITANAPKEITEAVCWDDSSLVDCIYCHTAIKSETEGEISGFGLRLLIECCSAPKSHLELVFLEIEEGIKMPVQFSYFVAHFEFIDSLRFGFSYNNLEHKCRRGYFRFIDLEYPEANFIYRTPSVLNPYESKLEREGYIDITLSNGGSLLFSNSNKETNMLLMNDSEDSIEVNLSAKDSAAIVDALQKHAKV
ncbi:MAG: hypothetical protein ACSHYA_17035 [Opitutaceae bacterium]